MPLFLLHGMHGDIAALSTFVRVLGPDQPVYAIYASGLDGRERVIDNMADMVRAYVNEIRNARPTGPIRLGGTCIGGLTAIEIARELQKEGRQTGPVILVDPPPIPPGCQNHNVDPRSPAVRKRLYETARYFLRVHGSSPYNEVPFDPDDSNQLHAAALAGVGALIAFSRYVPEPFSGPVALILSGARAARFFDPEMPLHKVFRGPRLLHVLPWNHTNFFKFGREDIACFVKFLLEQPSAWDSIADDSELHRIPSPEPGFAPGPPVVTQ